MIVEIDHDEVACVIVAVVVPRKSASLWVAPVALHLAGLATHADLAARIRAVVWCISPVCSRNEFELNIRVDDSVVGNALPIA